MCQSSPELIRPVRLFSPKVVKELGTFQDGGLRHNNPINIITWEQKLLRPSHPLPDFVLSLGTGSPHRGGRSGTGQPPVRERFLHRLFKSFMLSMDGEQIWNEFRQTLPKTSQARYHRLNFEVNSLRLAIDDVSNMERLKSDTRSYMDSAIRLNSMRDAVYASMFYFQFDQKPVQAQGRYCCTGRILLRLNLQPSGRIALYHQLLAASACFVMYNQEVPCVRRVAQRPTPYCMPVQFSVGSMHDEVAITLTNITKFPLAISGLPRRASEIVEAQLLDSPFGRVDHVESEKRLPLLPMQGKRKADRMA